MPANSISPTGVASPQSIVGAVNATVLDSGSEVVIGALIFDGGAIPAGQAASFWFLGVATDPAVTSVGSVKLYDLGPSAGPEAAPVLRATLTIDTSTADNGKVLRKSVQLVPAASPGAPPQVFDTARLYQLRADRTVSGGSETFSVFQAGIVIE